MKHFVSTIQFEFELYISGLFWSQISSKPLSDPWNYISVLIMIALDSYNKAIWYKNWSKSKNWFKPSPLGGFVFLSHYAALASVLMFPLYATPLREHNSYLSTHVKPYSLKDWRQNTCCSILGEHYSTCLHRKRNIHWQWSSLCIRKTNSPLYNHWVMFLNCTSSQNARYNPLNIKAQQ